jgi:hypothetical protein
MIGMQHLQQSLRVLALVAVALVPLLARPAAAAAAESQVVTRPLAETNTALLARAARGAARRLAAQVPVGPGNRVALQAEGTDPLEEDMREALLQALNERRITCVLLPPLGADSGSVAEEAAPARPTGPGVNADGSSTTAGTSGGLAALDREAREYEALQAERRVQAARADSIAGRPPREAGAATPSDAAQGRLPVLTWRVQEARVDYVRMFRGGFFGAQRVERRAHADLALRLTPAGSDAIAWSASADTTVADVVLRSDLLSLEDRTRPETRPALPSASFKKVLEPALVVVLIAGLVSLFYQNRP